MCGSCNAVSGPKIPRRRWILFAKGSFALGSCQLGDSSRPWVRGEFFAEGRRARLAIPSMDQDKQKKYGNCVRHWDLPPPTGKRAVVGVHQVEALGGEAPDDDPVQGLQQIPL